MKIVADNKIPFLKGVLEPFAEVLYLPGKSIGHEALKDADALITRTRTKCTGALLEGTSVKHIATATIGFDHINVPEVESLGITWNNAPGCNAASVGQYVSCALQTLGTSLEGKTLGVVGVGHVGSIVAALGEAMGMKVLRNDPPRQERGEEGFVSLEEVLESSDVVTLHVPLEAEGKYPTLAMADKRFFSAMRKGSVFFNAARGEAMVSSELKAALRSGQIGAAIIDVWENEPDIDRELLDMVHIGTMHIAGYSTDGKANGTAASVQAVAKKLGITELLSWRPETLPVPLEEEKICYRSFGETLLHTYDPRRDSELLKKSVSAFEELRGSYPIRREFPAFTVCGAPEKERKILERMGFKIN